MTNRIEYPGCLQGNRRITPHPNQGPRRKGRGLRDHGHHRAHQRLHHGPRPDPPDPNGHRRRRIIRDAILRPSPIEAGRRRPGKVRGCSLGRQPPAVLSPDGPINRSRRVTLENNETYPGQTRLAALLAGLGFFDCPTVSSAVGEVSLSNRYTLHSDTKSGRGIEGGYLRNWVEVVPAPDETSALLMAGVSKEAGAPTNERQGAGFATHDPLSAILGEMFVPESALAEARRRPEDSTGLGSW